MTIQDKITSIVSFNPNTDAPRQLWSSYVASRSPSFKVFTEKHFAQQGPRIKDGSVFFLCGGDWVLYEVWVEGNEVYR